MNERAIRHNGRGADCFALDAHTFRVRLSTARGDCTRVDICYALNKYAWYTRRETLPMRKWASDERLDYYQIDLTGDDTRLSYLFVLYDAQSRWYFTEEGLTDNCNLDEAHYFFFQYPFIHACDVHRVVSWADTAVMYQIFPERFDRGLGDKDYITAPWDSAPTPKTYLGGDLPGITRRLDTLTDLGVNCLYLTPIHPSPTNHKYSVVDYEDVDAAFGGKAAFRAFMRAARARGVRVVMDGVFNHCSVRFPPFADVVHRGRESPYWDWFFIDGERVDLKRVNYRTFGFSGDMPKLNTGHPAVIAYFCRLGAMWVRRYGISGWRLDVMDELSDAFLRAFRAAVKAADPDALLIGETLHDPGRYCMGDQLDGVMNYGLTKALMDYLVARTLDAGGMAARLLRLYTRTPAPAARMMMNLIGCHDTVRFLTLLKGDARRMRLAFCLLFFYVGIPCVYYGDEIGMEGGYDPGCRRGFPWDEALWNKELRKLVQSLCALRRRGLLAGDDMAVEARGDALILTRPGARLLINAGERPAALVLRNQTRTLDACSCIIEEISTEPCPSTERSEPE